jgi:ABC-type long-subunit fatty acid transport system fused permease/ATPase subunit
MKDLKDLILKFLEAIEYSDNKEEFINNFTSIIYLESVETLLNTFPQDKQEVVKQQLSSAKSTEAVMAIVNINFDQKSFQDTVTVASEKVFTEYLDLIKDVLTDKQKSKLQQFLQLIPVSVVA